MTWSPSSRYSEVVEANALHYAVEATFYDTTETCVVSHRHQRMLQADLTGILEVLARRGVTNVRALDACGGSGNVALKLLAAGAQVTLCDVSTALSDIFKEKCVRGGFTDVRIHVGEIGEFLASSHETFDLIVFSSALHHLEDYTAVLALATERLGRHGLLYTVFDPVIRPLPIWSLEYLDFVAFKVRHQPGDLIPALGRRLRRRLHPHASSQNPGLLAEYHVRRGIDDYALLRAMSSCGLEVVWHCRYTDARHGPLRSVLRRIGSPTSFKVLLSKPTTTSSNRNGSVEPVGVPTGRGGEPAVAARTNRLLS